MAAFPHLSKTGRQDERVSHFRRAAFLEHAGHSARGRCDDDQINRPANILHGGDAGAPEHRVALRIDGEQFSLKIGLREIGEHTPANRILSLARADHGDGVRVKHG